MAQDTSYPEAIGSLGYINGTLQLFFIHDGRHYGIDMRQGHASLEVYTIPTENNGNVQRYDLRDPVTDPARRQNTLLLADRALQAFINTTHRPADDEHKKMLDAIRRELDSGVALQSAPAAAPTPRPRPPAP